MRTIRRVGGGAALLFGLLVITGTPALGGSEPPGDTVDDAVLEQIRERLDDLEIGDDTDDEAVDAAFGDLADLLDGVALDGDGSELTGPCGGFAVSYDGDGELLDAAFDAGDAAAPIDLIDGEQAFTSSNPFEVDAGGRVAYFGFAPRSGEGPMDHEWSISAGGFPIASGGGPNTPGDNRNAGEIDLGDELPFAIAFRAGAEGSLRSSNLPECVGRGHIEFVGNGLLTVPGAAAILLTLGGAAGLLFTARPARTWSS